MKVLSPIYYFHRKPSDDFLCPAVGDRNDGPGLDLRVNDARPGGKVEAGASRIELEAVSSREFGKIDDIAIHVFDKGGNLNQKRFDRIEAYNYKVDLNLDLKPGFVYAQALTVDKAICVTSPVYIE